MTGQAGQIVLFASFVAVGTCLVGAFGLPFSSGWRPTAIGLAPFLGLLGCGFVALIFAAIDIRVVPAVVIAVTGAVAAAGAVAAHRRGSREPWIRRSSHSGVASRVVEIALLAIGAVVSIELFRVFSVSGLDSWDGWAIWGLHAHALYVDGTATGPVFTDAAYLGGHPEYPILYPQLEAMVAHAAGGFEPGSLLLLPAFFFVSGSLALWAVLRTVVEPVLAAAVATSLLGVPSLVENFNANYADGALALTTALGAVLLLVWLTSASDTPLLLGAAVLGCAGLVKLDGMVFSAASLIALAVVARGSGRPLRPIVHGGAVALTPAFLWIALVAARGVHQDAYRFRTLVDPNALDRNQDRARVAASTLMKEFVNTWPAAISAMLIACMLALVARRLWPALFIVVWLGLSFTGLLVLYVASTAPIQWHLTTSAPRVVFAPAVGVFALAVGVASDAWDSLRPAVRLWPRRTTVPVQTSSIHDA